MINLGKFFLISLLLGSLASCGSSDSSSSDSDDSDKSSERDITDTVLTETSTDCSDYAGTYTSSVADVNNGTNFEGSMTVSTSGSECVFSTNSIPNHDFNDGSASFATDVAEVDKTYNITANPTATGSDTALTLGQVSVIFLNGAVLDIFPAACYGVGSEPLGSEKIGCTDNDSAWRYDPMYSGNDFGTDTHNAHAQPTGLYHYHGDPLALYDVSSTSTASPVIGFAADGFPVYGPYFNDGGTVRAAEPSWQLRTSNGGTRNLTDILDINPDYYEDESPGGTWDGTYRDDYEYVDSSGDLDECNGMTVNGQYGYYMTNSFPWGPNCFKGTKNSTFGGS